MIKPELLGKTVVDMPTGMIGKATLYTITEHGLEQYLVEPEWKDGIGSEGRLLEKGRLQVVGEIQKEDIEQPLEENRGQIFRK